MLAKGTHLLQILLKAPGLENVLYFKVQYSPHFESMVILHMYSVGDVYRKVKQYGKKNKSVCSCLLCIFTCCIVYNFCIYSVDIFCSSCTVYKMYFCKLCKEFNANSLLSCTRHTFTKCFFDAFCKCDMYVYTCTLSLP